MGELIGSSKPNIDFAAKEIVLSMQTGQYTVTAAWADVGNGFEITIPKTGRYRITCQFTAYSDWTTNNENGVIFSLTKNAAHIPGTYGRTHRYVAGGQVEIGQLCHVDAPLQNFVAGDVVRLRAYKNNTDPQYIAYGNTFNGWSDGYLQAEMIDAYAPVVQSEERLYAETNLVADTPINYDATTPLALTGWTITIPRTGRYKLKALGSFQLDDNDNDGACYVDLELGKNGVGINGSRTYHEIYGNAQLRVGSSFYIENEANYTAGDIISLRGRRYVNNSDVARIYGSAAMLARLSYESVSDTIPIIQSDDYSETETPTGRNWIDGNPIYRKVIDFGAPPNATTKSLAHGITGLDKIIPGSIGAIGDNGALQIPFPRSSVTDNECVDIYIDNTNIVMNTWSATYTAYLTYVTLEYTKV